MALQSVRFAPFTSPKVTGRLTLQLVWSVWLQAFISWPRFAATIYGADELAQQIGSTELGEDALVSYRASWAMRKPPQFGVLACVVIAVLALLWISPHGGRRERELDAKGDVIVTGDGTSPFSSRYREAADLIRRGRVSEAQSIYMDLTNKEPGSPNGYVGLGVCCLDRKDVTGAQKLYEAALGLAPRSVNALLGLGTTYSLESDYANAAKNYELALAVDEGSPEAHWGLAIAYTKMGRQTDAINHLNRFKALAPDSRHIAALQEIVDSAIGQDGAANGSQPIRSATNRISSAAGSRR